MMEMTMETQQIVQALGQLTAPQLVALTKQLEDEWGVTAAPVPYFEVVREPGETAPPAPEQTEFTLVLKSVGPKKLDVIKLIRETVPGLGLKEAKELSERVESAPQVLRDGVTKAEVEVYQKKLTDAGATVEVR